MKLRERVEGRRKYGSHSQRHTHQTNTPGVLSSVFKHWLSFILTLKIRIGFGHLSQCSGLFQPPEKVFPSFTDLLFCYILNAKQTFRVNVLMGPHICLMSPPHICFLREVVPCSRLYRWWYTSISTNDWITSFKLKFRKLCKTAKLRRWVVNKTFPSVGCGVRWPWART